MHGEAKPQTGAARRAQRARGEEGWQPAGLVDSLLAGRIPLSRGEGDGFLARDPGRTERWVLVTRGIGHGTDRAPREEMR
jgi:hypothetical protein